ncbi:MAG TPA: SAM-dependent methyltransferase [Verrucomicrobiota bacterium]|nr:SAM-dependent methyltransferase [Verrucomicrobiota bacterium]
MAGELERCRGEVVLSRVAPGLLSCPGWSLVRALLAGARDERASAVLAEGGRGYPLVFARQLLPGAHRVSIPSIRAGAQTLFEAIAGGLGEGCPWLLHVVPHYGSGDAGGNRCRLIRAAALDLLHRRRRGVERMLGPDAAPFTARHALVQLLLTTPDAGLLSVAPAPMPHGLRAAMSPFPKGNVPVARDLGAPCRAFAKLVEAERRLGRCIRLGETCVDLGASPGSWTRLALERGAAVVAVDRAPLRADLMGKPRLRYVEGDAFSYQPERSVDWLLCDVVAAPERSVELLVRWAREGLMRQFVVTVKFKGEAAYGQLEVLKEALWALTEELHVLRLCANKNEACAFGVVRQGPDLAC